MESEDDISVHTNYLPYSSNTLIDITHYEEADTNYLPYSSNTLIDITHYEEADNKQSIEVVTGYGYNSEGWSDNSNLPDGWSVKSYPQEDMYSGQHEQKGSESDPYENRPNNSNLHEDWHYTCTIPEGWMDSNPGERRKDNDALPAGWKATKNNKTLTRDNRCLLASKLPTIFVTNHRSFFPKFKNFIDAMQTLDLTLGVHSEIWEDKESKVHQNKVEEALELEGIHYISNTRPDRRGGGAAISLMSGDFTLTRLDVKIPKNLEVVWGLVRPNIQTKEFKGIIVCAFYSVPNSKRKTKLVEHISINYGELKAGNKECFFLVGGDKNDLDIQNILDISPTLHMHITGPTHGKKNIDVLVSDMAHLYCEPVIIPNVPTDIPSGRPGGGKPSDHPIVYSKPRLERLTKPPKEVVIKKARRFNNSRIKK